MSGHISQLPSQTRATQLSSCIRWGSARSWTSRSSSTGGTRGRSSGSCSSSSRRVTMLANLISGLGDPERPARRASSSSGTSSSNVTTLTSRRHWCTLDRGPGRGRSADLDRLARRHRRDVQGARGGLPRASSPTGSARSATPVGGSLAALGERCSERLITLLGFIACLIPGIYLAVAFTVAVPALLMTEDLRGRKALGRSRAPDQGPLVADPRADRARGDPHRHRELGADGCWSSGSPPRAPARTPSSGSPSTRRQRPSAKP